MSYIVRVVGYNAYWTGDTEPGKLWSTNLEDSKIFEDKEEAQKIVDSGNNMEVIDYSSALPMVVELKSIPDWDAIDEAERQLKNNLEEKGQTLGVKVTQKPEQQYEDFVNLSSDDFETVSDEIHEVNVEVID